MPILEMGDHLAIALCYVPELNICSQPFARTDLSAFLVNGPSPSMNCRLNGTCVEYTGLPIYSRARSSSRWGMACWLDKQIRAMNAGISLTASVSRWFELFTGDWLGPNLNRADGRGISARKFVEEGARPIHSMGRLVSGSGHIFDTCTIDRGGKREEAWSESPCRVIGWDGGRICGRWRSERGFQHMLFWLHPWRQGGVRCSSWLNRSVRIERKIGA